MTFSHGGTLFQDHTHLGGLILPTDLDPALLARITGAESDIDTLQADVDVAEADIDTLQANSAAAFPLGFAAWTAYTPTLTQSATPTKTVNRARYMRVG